MIQGRRCALFNPLARIIKPSLNAEAMSTTPMITQFRTGILPLDMDGLLSLLPDGRIERLEPAFHCTMMPLCSDAGPAVHLEDGDNPVCTDPPGTDRAMVYQAVIENISDSLGI